MKPKKLGRSRKIRRPEHLEEIRSDNQRTIKELAEAFGVSHVTIHAIRGYKGAYGDGSVPVAVAAPVSDPVVDSVPPPAAEEAKPVVNELDAIKSRFA